MRKGSEGSLPWSEDRANRPERLFLEKNSLPIVYMELFNHCDILKEHNQIWQRFQQSQFV